MLRLLRALDRMRCRALNRMIFRLKHVDCRADIGGINGVVRIIGRGRISIGPGTRMNSGARRNPIGGDTRLLLVCRGGEIVIGAECGLSNCALVSDTRIEIGPRVLVGGGVKIYDTDFHNIDPERRREEGAGEHHGLSRPVSIGQGAFIGAHSIILKGVTIGDNSVIGAGSVVGRDVPPDEIWAGNPARFIRSIR